MNTDGIFRDLALLAARVIVGGSMAAHGAQKMFGAFGGPGLEGVSQHLGSLGFEPPEKYARVVSMTEMTCGTLLAFGALGPVGPAMLTSVMVSAIETVHRPKGYWNTDGGYEMNVMYMIIALLLATEGYGSISVDAALGIHERTSSMLGWLGLAAGVTAAMFVLSQRRESLQQGQAPQVEQPAETAETETPATVS
jgi:putative oxidoreductase